MRCPHCLHPFRWKDVLFRCQAPGTICAPEKDMAYGTFFLSNADVEMPALTPARGQNKWGSISSLPCRLCATPTSQEACPTCHGNLPTAVHTARLFPIALLSQEPMEAQLYVEGLCSYLKRIGAHDMRAILKDVPPLDGFLLEFEKETRQSSLLIVFYTLKPEDLSHSGTQHLLKSMKGFLLLHPGSFLCEGENDKDKVAFLEMVREMGRYFKTTRPSAAVPVGIAFTGLERWGNALFHPAFRTAGTTASAAVSCEISAYLGATLDVNTILIIKNELKNRRYFPLSTHISHKIRDYDGIEAPFLWILGDL